MKMAVTRVSLAGLLLLAFCAVSKVKSTTVLMDANYKKVNVLIKNDLNQNVTMEGPGPGPGPQLTEVPKTEKLNLTFEGSGTVTVIEDGVVILKIKVGDDHLNLVRTHSSADLTEVLGNAAISQKADQLNLTIRGNEDAKHSFTLSEDKSITQQSIRVHDNSIAIRQASDQIHQSLTFYGDCEGASFIQDKPGDNQKIVIRGLGLHTTSMHKDKGVTTVIRRYEK